jgi:predicted permease
VYLLMIAGAFLRRTRILPPECDVPVMQLVYRVMLPCFMLDKILGSAVLKSGSVVVWSIFLGFGMIMVGILLGLAVGRLIGLERGTGMRTFALSSGCQNFGFTAAPVIEILWGAGALSLLFVHNIGVETAMWSVGVMMMSGERSFSW